MCSTSEDDITLAGSLCSTRVEKESNTRSAWFLHLAFSISLIALLQRSVYHKEEKKILGFRLSPWEAFMGRIQFKIPSLSVKLFFFYSFSISSRCHMNTINLFCICYAHRGDNMYALLADCSIIHYSPHWLLNMKHAFSIKPLLSLGQRSVTGMAEFSRDL